MRALLVVLALLTAGCLGAPPADKPVEAAEEAAPTPAATEPPSDPVEPAPSNSTEAPEPLALGEASVDGKATLIAHPVILPTDVLGLRVELPGSVRSLTYVVTWNATLPAQADIALRVHEKGVLDDAGHVDLAGGAPLVATAKGASPLTLILDAAQVAPGTYDAHVYPANESMPVVEQPFRIVATWTYG